MIKGLTVFAVSAVLLTGCNMMDKVIDTENIETTPADFVIEQNSTDVVFELNNMLVYDHQVIFKRKQFNIPESEKARLLEWLESASPAMIAVRGTGGAERHRELGYKRATTIVEYLRSQGTGVDSVLLDYDATLLGGQALITVIPDSLAQEVKANAPILIISSN